MKLITLITLLLLSTSITADQLECNKFMEEDVILLSVLTNKSSSCLIELQLYGKGKSACESVETLSEKIKFNHDDYCIDNQMQIWINNNHDIAKEYMNNIKLFVHNVNTIKLYQ